MASYSDIDGIRVWPYIERDDFVKREDSPVVYHVDAVGKFDGEVYCSDDDGADYVFPLSTVERVWT